MEQTAPKTLERIVSQRALQMGSSFPCQICVLGFLCGVCLTYFFLAAMTSSGIIGLGGASFSNPSAKVMLPNSSVDTNAINMSTDRECGSIPKDIARRMNAQKNDDWSSNKRASLLHSAWSAMLNLSLDNNEEYLHSSRRLSRSRTPEAPHLENCKLKTQVNRHLDSVRENETLPIWANGKGLSGLESKHYRKRDLKERERPDAPYPPWIVGSDEDNFPLTRKVQRDIWIHQHPLNCSDPRVRFLVVDWETLPGFGIGAQLAGMSGLLAIAINEKRVLVTNYFNRADHDGCEGLVRSRWSCYFFLETSLECVNRALELTTRKEAWYNGIVTGKHNYTSKQIWTGQIPRTWGSPWLYLQPTTEINGSLIRHHRKMDMRWWRAQAVRYLMRFQSEYTCGLLNVARHAAFGLQAAEMVLDSLRGEWPETTVPNPLSDMEQVVWSNHKPWIPRPLLSMHVRMGDKACEMKVVEFDEYMNLADRIRRRFPYLNSIWLSTEMQEVIDKTRTYPNWKFYYTNVTRQVGNVTMASYEESLGRQTSTNYPLTNFLMAAEADFFIGALGSTWCFLIDGMRNTGGKVTAGYLSVNKDRFW